MAETCLQPLPRYKGYLLKVESNAESKDGVKLSVTLLPAEEWNVSFCLDMCAADVSQFMEMVTAANRAAAEGAPYTHTFLWDEVA